MLTSSRVKSEDLLGIDFYLKLINAEYASGLNNPIKEKDLQSRHPRIIVRLEEHFADNPLTGKGGFNHYRPARYLAECIGKVKIPDDVLDRFEKVCKAVNERLNS